MGGPCAHETCPCSIGLSADKAKPQSAGLPSNHTTAPTDRTGATRHPPGVFATTDVSVSAGAGVAARLQLRRSTVEDYARRGVLPSVVMLCSGASAGIGGRGRAGASRDRTGDVLFQTLCGATPR